MSDQTECSKNGESVCGFVRIDSRSNRFFLSPCILSAVVFIDFGGHNFSDSRLEFNRKQIIEFTKFEFFRGKFIAIANGYRYRIITFQKNLKVISQPKFFQNAGFGFSSCAVVEIRYSCYGEEI